MLPIQTRIERTQRLLQMFEQDAPLLANRVAELTADYQRSAKAHAAELTERARAELQRLLEEQSRIMRNTEIQAATRSETAQA